MNNHSKTKKRYSFDAKDVRQIKALGLTVSDVLKHLDTYRRGSTYLKLVRPCIPGDGIRFFAPSECKRLIQIYDAHAGKYKVLKFVPASGAASRMFAEWFTALEKSTFGDSGLDRSFFADLKKMPFYPLLEKEDTVRSMVKQKNVRAVLKYILLSGGLNYGWLPKALIPFHAYQDGQVRVALEEHLGEAAGFIADTERICHLHATISKEHVKVVKAILKSVVPVCEKRHQVRFEIDLSTQSPETNILAVDEKDQPFRDENGRLVFRPGGHGVLLENLQRLDADLIFIKNIDNIAPEILQKKILPYKKILGGLALQLQQSVFAILRRLKEDPLSARELQSITAFSHSELQVILPKDFTKLTLCEKKQRLFSLLNRPLRVCGMVKNEGEPGGGPFWVLEKDKSQTLQIAEAFHVNQNRQEQKAIWLRASYFNPVDMVCCIKNYLGERFNLADYVNPDSYSISTKTEKGRKLKAQEMPGLWNGSMANWNTVFVELPLRVFNPVKTVYDLLRPQHRSGRAKSRL